MIKTRRKRRYSILNIIVLSMMLIGFFWGVDGIKQRFNHTRPSDGSYEIAVIDRVVDGDTINVSLNHRIYTVRLIGLDAPESVHPDQTRNTPEGILAADYVKQALPPGKTVYLSKDVSETDQYGRLLRYVWLIPPGDSDAEIRSGMFNAILILAGYANQSTYQPDVSYAEKFKIYQREAKLGHRGLWK